MFEILARLDRVYYEPFFAFLIAASMLDYDFAPVLHNVSDFVEIADSIVVAWRAACAGSDGVAMQHQCLLTDCRASQQTRLGSATRNC
jgi:hypothetical protein